MCVLKTQFIIIMSLTIPKVSIQNKNVRNFSDKLILL